MMQFLVASLFTLSSFNHQLIDCQTGVLPDHLYRATLDLSDNRLDYISTYDKVHYVGSAVHANQDGVQVYQLMFNFAAGVQLLYDGGEDWWLCHDQNICLRCDQYLKP